MPPRSGTSARTTGWSCFAGTGSAAGTKWSSSRKAQEHHGYPVRGSRLALDVTEGGVRRGLASLVGGLQIDVSLDRTIGRTKVAEVAMTEVAKKLGVDVERLILGDTPTARLEIPREPRRFAWNVQLVVTREGQGEPLGGWATVDPKTGGAIDAGTYSLSF